MDANRDPKHQRSTFERWNGRLNRRQGDPSYRDEWYAAQCGRCEFWVPLAGALWGLDHGGCTNAASPFDATVRFEHDGGDAFAPASEWGVPEDLDGATDG